SSAERLVRTRLIPAFSIALELLALAGLVLARREPLAWMLALFVALGVLSHCLLVDVHLRHRILTDVPLSILAIYVLPNIPMRIRRSNSPAPPSRKLKT